jgi:hypothetical protein
MSSARGTSNKNQTPNSAHRRRLRQHCINRDGNGVTVLCAFGCGVELTVDTATLDRYPLSGHDRGTYRKDNVRAACGSCNSRHGSLDMHVRLGHKVRSLTLGDPIVTLVDDGFTVSLPYLVELDS